VIVTGQTPGVFLFTDIVGSTGLWAEQADRMRLDLAVHDDCCRAVFAECGGRIFSSAGDSFGVVFSTPDAAVTAAVKLQQLIRAHPWTVDGGLAIRIGIHMGEAQERNQNFYGPALNEAARIMSVGHGGQIVVSDKVARRTAHPMRPLGEHRLRDLDGRWSLHQVDVPGFETDHEPLASLGAFRAFSSSTGR
jgi:class 3 adenylate cyclase